MTPQALDLLDEAVSILRNLLGKTLSGESRYLALLTANAVALARRESVLDASLETAHEALADYPIAAIRSGALDGDATLYERLRAHAALRAWVANPDALDEAQRRQYLPGIEA